jgi:nucleoside-diphosphate-sugar epimerase
MIGSGSHRFHPADINDVVDALALAGTAPGVEGETFIIGGAAPLSLREFLEYIASAMGVRLSRLHVPLTPYKLLLAVRSVAAGVRRVPPDTDHREFWSASYEIDDSKARRRLGYAPQRSIKEAISATASWYRERGLL